MIDTSNFRSQLWFDVGIKRYTTRHENVNTLNQLWFDVGIKRYTTLQFLTNGWYGCGLM